MDTVSWIDFMLFCLLILFFQEKIREWVSVDTAVDAAAAAAVVAGSAQEAVMGLAHSKQLSEQVRTCLAYKFACYRTSLFICIHCFVRIILKTKTGCL